MKVRRYNTNNDYPDVAKWWTRHGWAQGVGQNVLSPYGVIVEESGESICCGWLYMTVDTPIAWIGFVVSNPDSSNIKIYKAMKLMLAELVDMAKDQGSSLVYASFNRKGLNNALGELGFVEGGLNCTESLLKI